MNLCAVPFFVFVLLLFIFYCSLSAMCLCFYFDLHPICPPPPHFADPKIYAMTLSNDCNNPIIKIHKMVYVNGEECKQFYRRTELDIATMWPLHATCARAISGGDCVWRSGAALVMKLNGKWRLLGFGVYGPGCKAPARFLDYGMYHKWVKRSIARIGQPAITRLASNHIILRRTLSTLQRYGPCDIEETKTEIYTDTIEMEKQAQYFHITYNLTLYTNVEYSCVVFRADHFNLLEWHTPSEFIQPKISLRRWCAGSSGVCYDFQYLEIHFNIEIYFIQHMIFKVSAYGKEAKIIDPTLASVYANRVHKKPGIMDIDVVRGQLFEKKSSRNWFWFYKSDLRTEENESQRL